MIYLPKFKFNIMSKKNKDFGIEKVLKNLGIKNPAFFYGFAIPFFFYSALTNIQQLSYQKYDQQKLSKPWLSTVGLCTIFMLFASVQLNSYSPFIYYLYGIGGMMLTLACALSIFTINIDSCYNRPCHSIIFLFP